MADAILVVDDDAAMRDYLAEALEGWDLAVTAADSTEEALRLLGAGSFRAAVTDIRMKGLDGLEFTRVTAQRHPGIPVVVMTGFGSIESAVEAMRAGAYDFLTKPVDAEILARTLRRAVEHRALDQEVSRLRRAVADSSRADGLIGQSPAMEEVRHLIERIADAEVPVLIQGETGTGKELVARALHARGPAPEGPFVALNCAAVPRELLESELFGHEKGAFSGAHSARPGLFRQAEGGTLFLDEIGELPLELQPKLLRALQERRVRPVGGSREVPFRARVLAATHQDLEARVAEGRFRQDLYFRLNVLRVQVPPLRDRRGDVGVLAEHFLLAHPTAARKGLRGFSPEARAVLDARPWPGNVRELQNCVERALALASSEWITPGDLDAPAPRDRGEGAPAREPGEDLEDLPSMEEIEKRHIRRVLAAVAGNKARAARVLGFDRKTLYRKLERYGIEGP